MASVYEFDPAKEISYADLQLFTSDFCKGNRIGKTQFGELYRGKIPQGWRGFEHEKDVTVKMWRTETLTGDGEPYHTYPDDLLERMKGEIKFRSLPFLEGHQIVPRVEGYCSEMGRCGMVYDVKPFDTIYNLMSDPVQFGWRRRVKVALALARFLNLCHSQTPLYLVRNLCAEHVLLDHDFNPVIIDFAMISVATHSFCEGGPWGVQLTWQDEILGSYGYIDPNVYAIGHSYPSADRFSFGVILLELILKFTSLEFSQFLEEKTHKPIYRLALGIYKFKKEKAKKREKREEKEKEKEKESPQAKKQKVESSVLTTSSPAIQDLKSEKEVKCLLVHTKLQDDPDFDNEDGIQLSMLALSCVKPVPWPENTQLVVSQLEKLLLFTESGPCFKL